MNYVKEAKEYVSYFNENNSNDFKNEFYEDSNKPVLEKLQSICSKYNYAQYSHTECVLKYKIFKNFNDITNCIKKNNIFYFICVYVVRIVRQKFPKKNNMVMLFFFKNYIKNYVLFFF